jgi:DNA segregation ATPase FtsK/SpoIIIE-like protein
MNKIKQPSPVALQKLLGEFGLVGKVSKGKEEKGSTEYIFNPTKAVRARDVVSLGHDLERILGLPLVRIEVVSGQNAFCFKLYHKTANVRVSSSLDIPKTLYAKAVTLVQEEEKASISFIQRHLEIGYNQATSIVKQMEKDGIVSEADHVGKRTVFV